MNHCCMCKKELESAIPEEFEFQPYAGGDILLTFCYGSTKFDNNIGLTRFKGFICDDCAETIVPNLTESGFDENGDPACPKCGGGKLCPHQINDEDK